MGEDLSALSALVRDFNDACSEATMEDAQLTDVLERADSIWQEGGKMTDAGLAVSTEGLALAIKSRKLAREAQKLGEDLAERLQQKLLGLHNMARQNEHAEQLFQTRVGRILVEQRDRQASRRSPRPAAHTDF